MSGLKRLTERVNAPFHGSRVNREQGVIYGALICGPSSANGRDYPPAVWPAAIAKYEGLPVYADHAAERRVADKLGWVTQPRVDADGKPRGDVHLLRSHPLFDSVMEAAERNPALFGFSHVAFCRTAYPNGRETVEAIERPESLDLVSEPATTKGFFESKGNPVKTTLRAVVEARETLLTGDRRKAVRKWLAEDDMAPVMDSPVVEPDATDPDEAITDAFKQALHAQVDALLEESHTIQEFVAKCRELYKSHSRIQGKKDDGGDSEPDSDGGGDDSPGKKESRRSPDPWAVLAECQAEKFHPTPDQLKVLRLLTESADRLTFIRSARQAGAGERVTAADPATTRRWHPEQRAAQESRGNKADAQNQRFSWQD